MSRIRAGTPADMKFQLTEDAGQRHRKLEWLRQWIVDNVLPLLEDEDADPDVTVAEDLEYVRTWWDGAPAANQTLLIWPFADDYTIPADFAEAVGFLGGTIAAPVEIEVYHEPVFAAGVITGGTLVGTITIAIDGTFTFATTGGDEYVFTAGETLAAKWPNVTEANANSGAFVLKALFGQHATFNLLLAGDQQSGSDVLLLTGDQQDDGDDALRLVGG